LKNNLPIEGVTAERKRQYGFRACVSRRRSQEPTILRDKE
jgi:hypothetical protein